MSCYTMRTPSPDTFLLRGVGSALDPIILDTDSTSDSYQTLITAAYNAWRTWFGEGEELVELSGSMIESPDIVGRSMDSSGVITVRASGNGGVAAALWRLYYSLTPDIDPTNAATYEDYKEVTTLTDPIVTDAVASPGVLYFLKLIEFSADLALSAASREVRLSPNKPLLAVI